MKSGSLNVFFLALCSIIKVSKLRIQSYRLGVQRFRPDFEFEVNTNKFYKKYMKQNCPLKMLTLFLTSNINKILIFKFREIQNRESVTNCHIGDGTVFCLKNDLVVENIMQIYQTDSSARVQIAVTMHRKTYFPLSDFLVFGFLFFCGGYLSHLTVSDH